MTPGDVAKVLAKAQAYDRRTVGEADVLAWHEAIGDLPLGDALAAVTRHYRDSDAWLMPAHIRRHVADMRRDRQRGSAIGEMQALEADPTRRDRSAEVQALLADLRTVLPKGRPLRSVPTARRTA